MSKYKEIFYIKTKIFYNISRRYIMTDKDLEYLLDNLQKAFNEAYGAIESMLQKNLDCPDEIDRLIRGAKLSLDTYGLLADYSKDREWQEFLKRKYFEKKQLLDSLEMNFFSRSSRRRK